MQDRNQISVQCRMKTILKHCRKFNGCVQQVELANPSGANEQIIVSCYLCFTFSFVHIVSFDFNNVLIVQFERANEMMSSMKGFEAGFKFDHVWPILKPFVQAEEMTAENFSESPLSPNPSLSPFSIHLNNKNSSGGGSS